MQVEAQTLDAQTPIVAIVGSGQDLLAILAIGHAGDGAKWQISDVFDHGGGGGVMWPLLGDGCHAPGGIALVDSMEAAGIGDAGQAIGRRPCILQLVLGSTDDTSFGYDVSACIIAIRGVAGRIAHAGQAICRERMCAAGDAVGLAIGVMHVL